MPLCATSTMGKDGYIVAGTQDDQSKVIEAVFAVQIEEKVVEVAVKDDVDVDDDSIELEVEAS